MSPMSFMKGFVVTTTTPIANLNGVAPAGDDDLALADDAGDEQILSEGQVAQRHRMLVKAFGNEELQGLHRSPTMR